VHRTAAISQLRRNPPESIPVILLARLAVDLSVQNHGFGGALLLDAIKRSLFAAEIIGPQALVSNAVSGHAAVFYKQYGFRQSPIAAHLLMATVADLRATIR
jgi:predicted N-acetyltransferase YhbS